MRTILPFRIKMRPVRRLALISFEKLPDSLYTGMEFQYLDGEKYGAGYRVLASRTDGYIDIYDDTTQTIHGKASLESEAAWVNDNIR